MAPIAKTLPHFPHTRAVSVAEHAANTIQPTRAIMVAADGTAELAFADTPSAPVTLTLKGGTLYPFSVLRLGTGGDATTMTAFY